MAERPLRWTPHGREQARVRGLPQSLVEAVAAMPDSVAQAREGREIRQRVVEMSGRSWLVRVVIEIGKQADEIVTVYRTSRKDRYLGER
jgi:hypothetical protein